MNQSRSPLARYLRGRIARRVVARVGMAKLAILGAAVLACFLVFLVLLAAIVGASAPSEGEEAGGCTTLKSEGANSPPARLLPVYSAAAQKYGLGSRGAGILAAINYVESDYGESTLPGVQSGTNFAGAEGPMQFLGSSWEAYGVDGNGDGVEDPYDAEDAVFAAAHLLQVDGAPGDWYGAIFDYNHADWYVRKVERIAAGFGTTECAPEPEGIGPLPSAPVARLLYVAGWIESQKIPYCWGGGHAAEPGPSGGSYCWTSKGEKVFGSPAQGLDCSGAVRWLLVLSGYPDPGGIASGGFSTAFPSGPGAEVTIWSNAEHVFIDIAGRTWGTSASNFASGPGFAEHTTAGFLPSHPEGL